MPRGELRERLDGLPRPDLDVGVDLESVRVRTRRTRRRRIAVSCLTLVVALVGVGIVAARSGDDTRRIVAEPSPTSSTVLPRSLPKLADSATTRFHLPDRVGGPSLAVGSGSVWVGTWFDTPQCHITCGGVARLDPRTGRVITTIPVPKAPRALAFGHGALWAEVEVPDNSPALVVKIDPATNVVVAQAEIPGISVVGSTGHPHLAVGAGAVWALYGGKLTKFDVETGAVTASVDLGPTEFEGGIVASGTGVWLVGGVIEAIDPTTLATHEVATLPLGYIQTAGLAGDTIWLTEAHNSTPGRRTPTIELIAVDARTGHVELTGYPTAFVVAGGGQVWFQVMEALVELAPRSQRALRQAPVGEDTYLSTTAVADRSTVWLLRGQQLIRIRT